MLPLVPIAATATASLLAGGFAYASQWPASQVFGPTLISRPDPNQIALTFDDGPNPAATPQLLEVLARHSVHATFFTIGSFARREPALLRQLLAAGHSIGNHTMQHPRLSLQPTARIRQELADCNALLEDLTGSPIHLFRPPFGARRPYVLRTARELGLTPVMWNVAAHDWNPIGSARILANLESGIARNRRRGRASNLLLHDGGHLEPAAPRLDTVRAVDQLLTKLLVNLKDTPARFVPIDAWLTDS